MARLAREDVALVRHFILEAAMADLTVTAPDDVLRSGSVSVNGVRLYYWIGGDPAGTPVMLWHGFLGTGYVWRHVAQRLASAGYSVLVPDMRGYGDSDKPEGIDGYDARSLANEARELVRMLNFGSGKPIIHAAHDMGGLPALIWAADYPDEVARLLYVGAPVMLGPELGNILSAAPGAIDAGSRWWWMLPESDGISEAQIVGREREFLTSMYDRYSVNREAITDLAVTEYLRTFSGREGVLGSLGIHRAAPKSIEQTRPLTAKKLRVPMTAIGGAKGLGSKVGEMARLICDDVKEVIVEHSGHFVPEERPDAIVDEIMQRTRRHFVPSLVRNDAQPRPRTH
jgi:pimeloyl-ACP methyl ester carboxylesterase